MNGLLLAASLLVASQQAATIDTADIRYIKAPIINGDGTWAKVPASVLSSVPSWASRYRVMVDVQGRMWLYYMHTDGTTIFAQPGGWRGKTVDLNSDVGGMNFGVSLPANQSPDRVLGTDPAVVDTLTSIAQCPTPDDQGTAGVVDLFPRYNYGDFIVPAVILGAAVLLAAVISRLGKKKV
jgi:hypothetical protein